MRAFLLIFAVLVLGACSTNKVGLKYEAPAGVTPADPDSKPIAVGQFADARGDDPNWIGAIRGGFGNPIKTLVADQPVANIVRQAFHDGLRARQFTVSDTGTSQISGTIRQLNSLQVARLEANCEIEVRVVRQPSGQQTFSKVYTANNLEGSLVTFQAGIFGSVDNLRDVAEKTLRQVVDKALDDPALRAALRQ